MVKTLPAMIFVGIAGACAIFLLLSSNRRIGGAQLPYIWVQGTQMLVRRVAYMFHSI